MESRKVITFTSLTTVSTVSVSTTAIASSQQLDGLQFDDSSQGRGIFTIFTATVLGMLGSARQCT